MTHLDKKINYVKFDYTDKENIKKYTNRKYQIKFNWQYYIKYYSDLKITNLTDAWNHWINFGIKEKRRFFLYQHDDNSEKTTNKESKSKIKPFTNEKKIVDFKNITSDKFKKIQHHNEIKHDVKKDLQENNGNETNNTVPKNNNTVPKNNDNKNNIKSHTISLLKPCAPTNILNEQKYKLQLLTKHNLIYKNLLDDYDGVYYYGWKEVIQYFINSYNLILHDLDKQIFFDACLEKLLLNSNKLDKNLCLNEINNNKYQIITFIHHPPFQKWYNNSYRKDLGDSSIIFKDKYTNKKLFEMIEDNTIYDNICYLYTFSNYHKEYIYNNYPLYKNKLLSITFPIEITNAERKFDINLFNKNKQIIHIGSKYRNFKYFINFNKPSQYHKTILIKKEFEHEWNIISQKYKLDEITILKELDKSEYELLFVNSCVFLHLEDANAHNIVVECMKFNTPIIINKLPAVVEYLGEDYPLYYENDSELELLNNPNYFQKMVASANIYIMQMDKTKHNLHYFNRKINYDLKKLEIYDNKCLTWFCLINSLDDIDKKFYNIYNNFISQNNNKNLILKLIICDSLNVKPTENEVVNTENGDVNAENGDVNTKNVFDAFIDKLTKYCELMSNISYQNVHIENYSDFINYCFQNVQTHYLTIIDLNDEHNVSFSENCINYLNKNPTCDIVFTSYTISNMNYVEKFIFEQDLLIFKNNFSSFNLPETSMIFRNGIYDLIGRFQNLNDRKHIFRDFLKRSIYFDMNIKCSNNDIMFKYNVQ
jgi:hypothetical protein